MPDELYRVTNAADVGTQFRSLAALAAAQAKRISDPPTMDSPPHAVPDKTGHLQ